MIIKVGLEAALIEITEIKGKFRSGIVKQCDVKAIQEVSHSRSSFLW